MARAAAAVAASFANGHRTHERRTRDPVHRYAYDTCAKEARPLAPLSDTLEGSSGEIYVVIRALNRWYLEGGSVWPGAIRLLEKLLKEENGFHVGSGTTVCAESVLAERGLGVSWIGKCKKQLRDLKLLSWVRRTEKTDLPPGPGVFDRIEVPCIYSFTFHHPDMPERLGELMEGERQALQAKREANAIKFGWTAREPTPLKPVLRPVEGGAARLNPRMYRKAAEAAEANRAADIARNDAAEARSLAFTRAQAAAGT